MFCSYQPMGYRDKLKIWKRDFVSSREAKYNALMDELKWWGFDSIAIEEDVLLAMKTLSHQLSWRETMRVIHALRRKRNAE